MSVGAVILGFLVGGFLGLLAGYMGGRSDTFITGAFNVMLAVPAIVLALALVAFLQGSTKGVSEGSSGFLHDPKVILILALGIVSIPLLGRITRASALTWSQREFVLAARAPGREEPADHGPRGAAQRAAGDVLDRAARHRGRDRRRGRRSRSSASACSRRRRRGAT